MDIRAQNVISNNFYYKKHTSCLMYLTKAHGPRLKSGFDAITKLWAVSRLSIDAQSRMAQRKLWPQDSAFSFYEYAFAMNSNVVRTATNSHKGQRNK